MPLTVSVDKKRRLVVTHGTGVVTLDDIASARAQLRANPDFDPAFYELFDVRDVTDTRISGAEMARVAASSVLAPGVRHRESKATWARADVLGIRGATRSARRHLSRHIGGRSVARVATRCGRSAALTSGFGKSPALRETRAMRRLAADSGDMSSRRIDRTSEEQLSLEDARLRGSIAAVAKPVHENRVAVFRDKRAVLAGLVVYGDWLDASGRDAIVTERPDCATMVGVSEPLHLARTEGRENSR